MRTTLFKVQTVNKLVPGEPRLVRLKMDGDNDANVELSGESYHHHRHVLRGWQYAFHGSLWGFFGYAIGETVGMLVAASIGLALIHLWTSYARRLENQRQTLVDRLGGPLWWQAGGI